MTEIPLTRVIASKEKQLQIRNSVSNAVNIPGVAHIASEKDVDALTSLLDNPEISKPIYTLPQQINRNTISAFINKHIEDRALGEGLLMVSTDESGVASAYYDIQFWPQWAACELGGAIRGDRQGAGQGSDGAIAAFSWLFETIGVDLICETAALDNTRTAHLLERIGFTYMGEIESQLADGGVRPSHYWELSKANWYRRLLKK
ncbi:GNAT family N-acetyltransferase [Microbulbifer marinus]|uniref:Protein N-acetyltransferase, RimJ/RimL family n=1 Tax=Microbulbifer marinus TaxID=658218 RepID=A0A1H4A6Z2_9GAMM|nr:GNAT family N-acetyltransferase [Microbulbifer marinus]SEA31755.1 Protein N-acetyltransferase, RimJ/RimL family [Microbulbifer marinus]